MRKREEAGQMKTKKISAKLVIYELRNLMGNPYIAFFGIVFPIFMLFLITHAMLGDVPASIRPEANTSVFITMSLIIPMAVVLLGHAANYSQELEKEIPLRMKLFGFPERSILCAKAIAQIVALAIGFIIYVVLAYLLIDLEVPALSSALCILLCELVLGVLFFMMAHGLAGIFRKFGPTYAITMAFYFGVMILCGMMGIQTDQLPKALQYVAGLLPMSYIGSDFIDFWKGGSYNFGPMIQSYLFLGAVSGILLLYANYKNRRVIR